MASLAVSPKITADSSHRQRADSVGSTLLPAASVPPSRARSSTSVVMNFIQNGLRSNVASQKHVRGKFVSLYRVLLLELNLPQPHSTKEKTQQDVEEERRAYEQLANMTKIPFYLEKFIAFGLLVCLNLFLTLFTLVPLKICIVSSSALAECAAGASFPALTRKLHFVKRDIIILFLITASIVILGLPALEVSRLYHDIRGQAHIKLYVMFGVLEVADKLLSSLNHEVFIALVGIPMTNTSPASLGRFVFFLFIALFFSACHSYVLIYQSVSLHVAANSYSNALLALLLSNQFSELKSAVFKKFEREGLFQITMSDLTERFQLSIMLLAIALRNLSQLSSTELGLIPDSWQSWNKWFGAIFGPSVVVLGSEIFVDWVKHCFISKFNRIKPRVYDNFLYVLSLDFMELFTSNSNAYTLHEVSDYLILTKRIGLPIMSLSVCFLRMTLRDLQTVYFPSVFSVLAVISSIVLLVLTFVALLVTRLLLGLWLLKWARQIKHNHEAYQEKLRTGALPYINDPGFVPPEPIPEVASPESPQSPESAVPDSPKLPEEPFPSTMPFPKLETSFTTPDMSPTGNYKYRSPDESDNEIDSSFIPGVPNTESLSINPTTRSYLYDFGEKVPPTLEEKRNAQFRQRRIDSPITHEDPRYNALNKVQRYEMSSKRIW